MIGILLLFTVAAAWVAVAYGGTEEARWDRPIQLIKDALTSSQKEDSQRSTGRYLHLLDQQLDAMFSIFKGLDVEDRGDAFFWYYLNAKEHLRSIRKLREDGHG